MGAVSGGTGVPPERERRKAVVKIFAIYGRLFQAGAMTTPLALVFYENLLPGSQLVNRLQDLGYRVQTIGDRSEEHTSELQSRQYLVCRLLLEKKKT